MSTWLSAVYTVKTCGVGTSVPVVTSYYAGQKVQDLVNTSIASSIAKAGGVAPVWSQVR